MTLRMLLLAILCAICAVARADDPVRDRHAALLERGNAALARAMDITNPGDPAIARALREASAAYHTVLDAGFDGPALRLNLASIDAQLARRGPAVLHLRAAGRLASATGDEPALRAASAALRALRPGAGEAWPPDTLPGAHRAALSAANSAGVGALLAVFAGCWSLGWILIALRAARLGPRTPILLPAALLLAGGLTGAVLATAALADANADSLAVIVLEGATLRAGPGDEFDPVAASVSEGADVTLLGAQGGWSKVRVATGAEGWLPTTAAAPLRTP